MSNIIRLTRKYADREFGNWDGGRNAGDWGPILPEKIEDCMAEIAGFGEKVVQSLDLSQALLNKLDVSIASTRDPVQRSILQDERCLAEKTLLANSRILLNTLEFMASSAQSIRDQCCVITARYAPDHDASLKSGSV